MIRKHLLAFLSVLACLSCSTSPQTRGGSEVDLLISGGQVVTISGPDIPRGSVAIRQGLIVAVGPSAEVDSRYRARKIIHAEGQAVLPGFVNAHTHAPMTLFRGIADDRDLMDWLQSFIFPAEARNVDREFVRWGTRLAAAEMIRSGTTTFADMYYFEQDMADVLKPIGLRAVLGQTVLDFPAPDYKTWDAAMAGFRQFALAYRNDPLIVPALAPHAPYTVSREHLQEVRRLATELGVPILIHLSETTDELKTVAERSGGLRPAQYLASIGFLADDVTAAHGIWLSSEEIELLARAKVGVAHCPESNMMLASGVAPVIEMRLKGVEVGLGTDGPAGSNNNLDMIEEMASAARLQKITRKDPKSISARTVLEMATIGGARVLGLASKIGTLEPGKRADIIIIEMSRPRTQPVYSLDSAIVYSASGSDVVTTIVDGRILMENRRILVLDETEVVRQTNIYRDRILESLRPSRTE